MSKFTHMLLSLPSPSVELVKELNIIFAEFIWVGKPPKFRKEIFEVEIKEGGLKLHNIAISDSALKLGWLKRYLQSSSKWTISPIDFELEGVFNFGPEYINRIEAVNTNPFWQDGLTWLKSLWKTNIIFDKREAPIWYNPTSRLQIRREWKEKGIMVASDFLDLDYLTVPLSLEKLNKKFEIKLNFLEYVEICALIKKTF